MPCAHPSERRWTFPTRHQPDFDGVTPGPSAWCSTCGAVFFDDRGWILQTRSPDSVRERIAEKLEREFAGASADIDNLDADSIVAWVRAGE